jgi:N-carbamoyl-L-amino-acid hydrolase
MQNLRINGERLWASLMEMAKIGATPKGGVCRIALTDVDKAGRDLFVRWCKEAGCSVTVDAVGNIFARRAGQDDSLPAIATGSHLDSQPTGGKFDGVYGVLAGLEVIRSLNDAGVTTKAPVEVVCWTNEEGSRFAPAMVGSGAFAGVFKLEDVVNKTDIDGKSFGAELQRIGYAGEAAPGGRKLGAYFEAHIEQGPILEAEGKVIGAVTGAQGQRWYEVAVLGQDAHAGPTPMARRKDALVGASLMVAEVNRLGHAYQPGACATVGMLQVSPNSRNVIPGKVWFTVDTRHPDDARLAGMKAEMTTAFERIATEKSLTVDIQEIWYVTPQPFDAACINAVREGAKRRGLPVMDIISGAGHDAVYVAQTAPVGMIFVPCAGGLSHNELEDAKASDLAAGCDVLLHAMLDRAGA